MNIDKCVCFCDVNIFRRVQYLLFGPSTRDRKHLILGRFHRFRTVSVKVITTVIQQVHTEQQTMKSKKGNPSKRMGRFWFRKDVVQEASRSCHQQHDIMTILWVPIILGSFPWSFILCLSICLHTSYRQSMKLHGNDPNMMGTHNMVIISCC